MRKVLVVDDNDNVRVLYRNELKDEGYEVVTAACGRDALEIIAGGGIDLVLLDIKMPDMSGLEVLCGIREKDKELPVILLTAYDHYKQDFSSWAANEYVVKSADVSELKQVLKKYLGL